MYLLDQTLVGIAILLLLVALVTVKRIATGSVLDKPKGPLMVQLVNGYNLLFLLVVNPLAAALLITRSLEIINPTRIRIETPSLLAFWETAGVVIYVTGYLLMAWALIRLGRNYQLGGADPRIKDSMVITGPYKLVRHPMYTAALTISFGLACLTQSWAFLGIFTVYLGLILLLIPVEERGLQKAYEKQYNPYQRNVKKLIPFVY
jgi:protein-S-isoprenylcysteine O-methyltransferase Ste14